MAETVKLVQQKTEHVTIKPINLKSIAIRIMGTTPYVQCRFDEEAENAMRKKQEEGSTSQSRKTKKDPKNFEAMYLRSMFMSTEGWRGIPATAFRKACIDVCRATDFKMTMAKLAIVVEADGYDKLDVTPLVKITKGQPQMLVGPGRNATGGIALRSRAKWDTGWTATVRVTYDGDMFRAEDVVNLMRRAGLQNGVGCGRQNSRDSAGCGWGVFDVVVDGEVK